MTLTPKEKAAELVNDFVCFANLLPDQAIQCALLCVEFAEINPLNTDGYTKYLIEIRQELEKL